MNVEFRKRNLDRNSKHMKSFLKSFLYEMVIHILYSQHQIGHSSVGSMSVSDASGLYSAYATVRNFKGEVAQFNLTVKTKD